MNVATWIMNEEKFQLNAPTPYRRENLVRVFISMLRMSLINLVKDVSQAYNFKTYRK